MAKCPRCNQEIGFSIVQRQDDAVHDWNIRLSIRHREDWRKPTKFLAVYFCSLCGTSRIGVTPLTRFVYFLGLGLLCIVGAKLCDMLGLHGGRCDPQWSFKDFTLALVIFSVCISSGLSIWKPIWWRYFAKLRVKE